MMQMQAAAAPPSAEHERKMKGAVETDRKERERLSKLKMPQAMMMKGKGVEKEREMEEKGRGREEKEAEPELDLSPTGLDRPSVQSVKDTSAFLPPSLTSLPPQAGFPRAAAARTIPSEREDIEALEAEMEASARKDRTVLQQHVDFFDTNHDGWITVTETFRGFRRVGFNLLLALYGTVIIHFFLSYSTQSSWIPDWRFRIDTRNVHRAKHGSDSEAYDTEGRFVPQKFEEMLSKYDLDKDGGLSLRELMLMTNRQSNACDVFGWFATRLEWGFTWLLCADEKGVLSRECMRRMIDGSIFPHMEQLHQKRLRDREKGIAPTGPGAWSSAMMPGVWSSFRSMIKNPIPRAVKGGKKFYALVGSLLGLMVILFIFWLFATPYLLELQISSSHDAIERVKHKHQQLQKQRQQPHQYGIPYHAEGEEGEEEEEHYGMYGRRGAGSHYARLEEWPRGRSQHDYHDLTHEARQRYWAEQEPEVMEELRRERGGWYGEEEAEQRRW